MRSQIFGISDKKDSRLEMVPAFKKIYIFNSRLALSSVLEITMIFAQK